MVVLTTVDTNTSLARYNLIFFYFIVSHPNRLITWKETTTNTLDRMAIAQVCRHLPSKLKLDSTCYRNRYDGHIKPRKNYCTKFLLPCVTYLSMDNLNKLSQTTTFEQNKPLTVYSLCHLKFLLSF